MVGLDVNTINLSELLHSHVNPNQSHLVFFNLWLVVSSELTWGYCCS